MDEAWPVGVAERKDMWLEPNKWEKQQEELMPGKWFLYLLDGASDSCS